MYYCIRLRVGNVGSTSSLTVSAGGPRSRIFRASGLSRLGSMAFRSQSLFLFRRWISTPESGWIYFGGAIIDPSALGILQITASLYIQRYSADLFRTPMLSGVEIRVSEPRGGLHNIGSFVNRSFCTPPLESGPRFAAARPGRPSKLPGREQSGATAGATATARGRGRGRATGRPSECHGLRHEGQAPGRGGPAVDHELPRGSKWQ